MNIEVKIDEKYETPKILIYTREYSKRISAIVEKLSNDKVNTIVGFEDGEAFIIKVDNIINLYSEGQKVLATMEDYSGKKTLWVKYRLYELENLLENNFIRISNSEIVNFNKVKSLDFSLSGKIILKYLKGGTSFVSRRYIHKIKKYLNI